MPTVPPLRILVVLAAAIVLCAACTPESPARTALHPSAPGQPVDRVLTVLAARGADCALTRATREAHVWECFAVGAGQLELAVRITSVDARHVAELAIDGGTDESTDESTDAAPAVYELARALIPRLHPGTPAWAATRWLSEYFQTPAVRTSADGREFGPLWVSWVPAVPAHTASLAVVVGPEPTVTPEPARWAAFTVLDALRWADGERLSCRRITLADPDSDVVALAEDTLLSCAPVDGASDAAIEFTTVGPTEDLRQAQVRFTTDAGRRVGALLAGDLVAALGSAADGVRARRWLQAPLACCPRRMAVLNATVTRDPGQIEVSPSLG